MPSILRIAGKHLSLSISKSDLASIKKATDRNHIGSISDRIRDSIKSWFSDCNIGKAKKHLYDFVSPTTTDADRIKSFSALRNMVDPAYTDRFVTETAPDSTKYILKDCYSNSLFELNFQNIPYTQEKIQEQIEVIKKITNSEKEQVMRDFSGMQYNIDGVSVQNINDFDQRLKIFLPSFDLIKEIIYKLCHQGIFATIANAEDPKTSALGSGSRIFTLSPASNEGLSIIAECTNDIAAHPLGSKISTEEFNEKMEMLDGHFQFKSKKIKIQMQVTKEGEIIVEKVNSFVNTERTKCSI